MNQCILLDKNVTIQHWESHICEGNSFMNGLQGLKKNKCLTNFGFKLKLESPNYRQIKFCHLCQNWMSIQWQRAPVLIFFAFKLGTISGQLLARISCQPSTWRHVSILLSAIFCSIYLTLKDILACRAPNPVNKILKVYIQQRNLICHVWEHSVVCVIPTFHKCQQFLFSRLWKVSRMTKMRMMMKTLKHKQNFWPFRKTEL